MLFDSAKNIRDAAAIAVITVVLAGCSALQKSDENFLPLDDNAAQHALNSINSISDEYNIAKCKIKLLVTTRVNGNLEKYKAKALCLWIPGKTIRIRVSHLLAGTIADILFNGQQWYLTDEQNALVYICDRIDNVRMNGVPREFFIQMQRLPKTWLPHFDDKTKVSKGDFSYRIEKKVDRSESVWIFPFKSALPSEMEIKTNDKEVFRAAFYDVQTNLQKNVKMFEPITNGYQVKNLNTDY